MAHYDMNIKNFSIKYTEHVVTEHKKESQRYHKGHSVLPPKNEDAHIIRDSLQYSLFTGRHSPLTDRHSPLTGRHSKEPKKELKKTVNHKKSYSESVMMSMPLRDYTKVPIEFIEEKEGGGLEEVRGRIAYRGYVPKNSSFFLRAMRESVGARRVKHRAEVQFDSNFESGNLLGAIKTGKTDFWLFMREDTNTRGLRQWYYFSVTCSKPQRLLFRIYKFKKRHSLYMHGMKPYVQRGFSPWTQEGENVRYVFDTERKCFFLEFELELAREKVSIATLPPYTYTCLSSYLGTLKSNTLVHTQEIGMSLGGLPIPLLTICAKKTSPDSKRQAIVLLSRTHPGETSSNFSLQAFIDQVLLSPDLRGAYDFFIIPMVNPDGVVFGNHRTGLSGCDFNRKFHISDPQLFPQIEAVKQCIAEVSSTHCVQFLLDLHGHSARKNIFAYGEEHDPGSSKFLKGRILPKLLSRMLGQFKYEYCIFRKVREKKNTARVYFSRVTNAVTFEQSYGLTDEGCIRIEHWRNFGKALADALLEYSSLLKKGAVEEYLEAEIAQQQAQLLLRSDRRRAEILKSMEQPTKYPSQEPNQQATQAKQTTQAKQATQAKQTTQTPTDQSYIQEYTHSQKQQTGAKTEVKTEGNQVLRGHFQWKNIKNRTISDSDSIGSSQLSSGDEDCEKSEGGLEQLRREMRMGCLKEGLQREAFVIPDKKIELKNYSHQNETQPIMHEHKLSMMPRMLKLQMRKREPSLEMSKELCWRSRINLPEIKQNPK